MDISDCSANQKSECGNLRDEEEDDLCEASCSSSFGDSMCAPDGDEEEEAQPMLSKDYPLSDDGIDFLGLKKKKKKLTDKWRVFSQPLAWRCKWLELKVKEIQSQARVYEKQVQSYYENKQFDLEKVGLEGLEGKSVPFLGTNVFKKGRRKRVEDTRDVAAYFSNHNVFSYAEKRMPATLKAQSSASNFGTGRKATSKEDDIENDCLAYDSDCSDNFLAKLLCKIDEAQERAKRLRKRVYQLSYEPQVAHTSLMPQTIDLTVLNDKQPLVVMPNTAAHTTLQIGRQRISADHRNEDVLMPQAPPIQIDGQCLINNSPISSGGFRFHPILEDLLMDEPEMNDDETERDKEQLDYFRKLINEITGVPPEEEDPTSVAKSLSLGR